MAADSGTRTLVRPRRRIASLDALRGLTLVSMIAYHACWDLVYLFHADWDWYRGTGAYIWQQSICWTFILLSGFCFSLGRRPLRRGLTVFGCGWVVTLVTVLFMPEEQIWFGVLTLIGSCMLLMVPLEKLLRHVPVGVGLAASAALFTLLRNVNQGTLGFEDWTLGTVPEGLYRNLLTAYIGFPPPDFFSTDYFSLLPWLFLFLAGHFLRRLLAGPMERLDPDALRCPPLCALGRQSLPVYMLHQPIVYGVLLGGAAHPVPQADKQHVPAVPGPAEQALHQQSALAGVLQEYREAVPLPDCRTHGFRGTHLLPAGPPGQVRRQADGPYTSRPGQHLVQQPESGLPPHRLRSVLRQVRASPPEYPEVQPAQNTLTTAREERHARCLRRFG